MFIIKTFRSSLTSLIGPQRLREALCSSLILISTGAVLHADTGPSQNVTGKLSHEMPLVRTPTGIVANRTLPTGIVTSAGFQVETLPDQPSDEEIFRARVLTEPLVPTSSSTAQTDNADLLEAMRSYHANPQNLTSLEAFVSQHPASRWVASLELNLGLQYLQSCHFTKAFAAFQISLSKASGAGTPESAEIAQHAAAQLYRMNARVGRVGDLIALNQTTKETSFTGADSEIVSGARAGLWTMQNHPERAFLCGPAALEKIAQVQSPTKSTPSCISEAQSTPQGFSLLNVWRLSERAALNLQMVKRAPGSALLTPSVVHWKVGHFAAVLADTHGVLRIEDATFGGSGAHLTATQTTLDDEGSGYMLVPVGPLPQGYRNVSQEEAATIFGKGTVTNVDIDQTGTDAISTTCPTPAPPNAVEMPSDDSSGENGEYDGNIPSFAGVPSASATMMLCSLRISDTPLYYTPPVGPLMAFHLTYNQREASQPSVFFYGNVGQQWVSNWLSYVTEVVTPVYSPLPPGSPPGTIVFPIAQNVSANVNVPGGGTEYYPGFDTGSGSPSLPPPPYDFGYQAQSHTHLIKTAANIYEQLNPDGSSFVFGFKNSSTYFLTQAIDAQGNAETFSYDASTRLIAVTDAIGQVTTLSYNDPLNTSHITSVTDPFGRSCFLTYDTSGRLNSITDIIGMSSSFAYQAASTFIDSMTTPYGTSSFSFSEPASERYLFLTDPLDGTEEVHYVPGPEPTPMPTGPLPANMLVTSLNQAYRNTYYWNKKAYMDAPGLEAGAHLFHWNHTITGECSGNLENEKMPLEGSRTWYNYEGQTAVSHDGTTSNITSIGRVLDNGATQLRSFTYNSFGRILSLSDPLNRMETFQYVNNFDLSEIDRATGAGNAHDVIGQYTYNPQHRTLTAVDSSGQVTQMTYNARGQILTIVDPKIEQTTFAYDSNGYLLNLSGPNPGPVYSFTHDGFGRVATATDPDGITLTYDYDALNRLTLETYPDGSFVQTSYKNLDVEWKRDRLGRMTHYVHDSLRHLVQVEDQLFRSTYYSWCSCGSLLSVTDPNGNQTSWVRDVQGRLTKTNYADGSSIVYVYENSYSRLRASTDALNQTTNWSYFNDDSINQVSFAGAINATPSMSFVYDQVYPRLVSSTDGLGTTTYTYNPITTSTSLGAGKVATITGPLLNSTISYAYDQLGRMLSVAVNGSANSAYSSYDALGRVSATSNPLGSFTYTYDGSSFRLASLAYPNGQTSVLSYYPKNGASPSNSLFRLQQIANRNASGGNISTFGYSYNLDGTIESWSKAIDNANTITSTFKLDSTNQMTDAVGPTLSSPGLATVFAYKYDSVGNRVAEEINDNSSSASVNLDNELYAVSSTGSIRFSGHLSEPANLTANSVPATVDATENFSVDVPLVSGAQTVSLVAVDGNGNSVTKKFGITVGSNLGRNIVYDADGNVINDGAGKVYGWDALNRLISITQSSGVTTFVYDGFGRRSQETLNGTLIKQWVWAGERLLEERDGADNVTKRFYAQGEQISGVPYFFSSDHLGSVREMTDATGSIRARYDYDPFGRMTKISGDLSSDFGFAHYFFHLPSLLNLTVFRAYDPNIGRWLSRDPLGARGGLNPYSYADNDPIDWIDPFGLFHLIPSSSGKGEDGANTVVTNGNGGLVVSFGQNPPGESQLVLNSIAIHELNHIKDAYNQNNAIANDQPAGMILAPDTFAEQLNTEMDACNAQLDYLRKELADPQIGCYDKERVQKELTFVAQLYVTAYNRYNAATAEQLVGAPQKIW